mmetsp:Transcript_174/g.413  ORF Transcript_174/g.413 Transcript_174/m.413 type:complete len:312 (+) Transcript_174:44-979(+)
MEVLVAAPDCEAQPVECASPIRRASTPTSPVAAPARPAPSYGPNNSARRANRNRGQSSQEPTSGSPTRPSTAPELKNLLTSTPRSNRQVSSHDKEKGPVSPVTQARRNSRVQDPSPPAKNLLGAPNAMSKSAKCLRPQSAQPPGTTVPRDYARARSQSVPRKGDTYDLARFTDAQKENDTFDRALKEIQGGRKTSCWMWFVIPSPPHMKNNIEHGSSLNRRYAIRSDEEARAWLSYEADGVDLRANYYAILEALSEHLVAGKAAKSVIGSFDEPKLASSILFFERITRNEDNELNTLLVKIAGLMELQITP